jgi:putative transposase
MITFIDDNKARWGVEPICTQLPIAPSTYYDFKKRSASARATRDEELKPKIMRVFRENYEVYGADKIWAQMNREQVKVDEGSGDQRGHEGQICAHNGA